MGCVVAAALLAPSVASADEGDLAPLPVPAAAAAADTDDIVHLRSGGLFRGRVTEIVPGDHVTINVSGSGTRRLAWSEVERVVVASTTMPPPPAPAVPPPMVGPKARVHIKSSGHTTLFRRPAGSTDLVQACESPCDTELPLGDTYRIAGSGITTTKEFKLQASPGGSVELAVDGPSWTGIVGGGLITITGGFGAYVGSIFALAGGSADASCHYCKGTEEMRNVGIGLLVGGAALIGLGLAIVYPSMKTDLTQESGAPPAPPRDAFVRTPVWNTARVETPTAPATFPAVFERRF